MPDRGTVWRWLDKYPDFHNQYARARNLRKEALVERLMILAGSARSHAHGEAGTGVAGAQVQAVKLEIDTIKWVLSKEYRYDYGDKITQEITGAGGGPIKQESAMALSVADEAVIKQALDAQSKLKRIE